MCFSSKQPAPVAPPPAPTERDANIQGVAERRRQVGINKQSGFDATLLTGPGGLSGPATTGKVALGQ